LRSRFVAHQERLALTCLVEDWVMGSPENPWPDAFRSWTDQIRDHVGAETHDTLICDFSTSGPVEITASRIVMMGILQRYFKYVMIGICGIHSVTLTGTSDDWLRLTEKAARLEKFDVGWWLAHLLPICKQFAQASQGRIDLPFWQSICKLREAYGGHIING